MEQRVYEIAAALALEVGKNRMEALGEAQETVDFFRYYADDFESHGGYEVALPNDPLDGVVSHNRSVLRPYGVWAIIAPFNFPLALAGGPTAAALVTGNTVVLKCASDTPWSGRLLADCIRDAGLPAGVFNYLSGGGAAVGEAMVRDPRTAGVTFTGSAAVGRSILQQMAAGADPQPCIAEMGGKNPVHRHRPRRSRSRGDRHRALGLRHGRAEVLGAVAPVRRPARRRRTARADRAAGGCDPRSATRACGRTGWGPSSTRTRTATTRATSTSCGAQGATLRRGGRQLRENGRAAATTSSRCSPRRRSSIRCGARRCSCRS